MSACDRVRPELKAFADAEVAWWRRGAIARHVAGCVACQREVAEMEQVSADARASETLAMDGALRRRILAAVAADTPEAVPGAAEMPAGPLWRRPMTAWGAVATAALLVVVYSVQTTSTPQASDAVASKQAMDTSRERLKNQAASSPAGANGWSAGPDTGAAQAPMMEGKAPAGNHSADAGKAAGTSYSEQPPMLPLRNGVAQHRARGRSAAPASLPGGVYVRRTASLTVAVSGIDERAGAVERLVRESGGYVEHSELASGAAGSKNASLRVRVPVATFDAVLKTIGSMGVVRLRNVQGEDLTAQVSDEQQAVQVLEAEARRADGEARVAERELAAEWRLRAAQARARLEALRKVSAFGLIEVTLTEEPRTAVDAGGFAQDMRETARSAANAFMAAVRIPLAAAIWVLAYSPIWLPLAAGYRIAARAQRRRRDERVARDWHKRRSAETTAG